MKNEKQKNTQNQNSNSQSLPPAKEVRSNVDYPKEIIPDEVPGKEGPGGESGQ